MNKSLLVLLVSASLASPVALAAERSAPSASTLRDGLHARYCDKLRQSALDYVLFVRRLAPIYGYTYTDFAPEYPGAPVKADCRVELARVAEVHALLRAAS